MVLLHAALVRAADLWQHAPDAIRAVLDAPELPAVRISPDGRTVLLTSPVRYPPVSDLAAPMHRLAGMRVDPRTGGYHTPSYAVGPELVSVADGHRVALDLADDVRILNAEWSADADRIAIVGQRGDHLGLWLADLRGLVVEVPALDLVPLLGGAVQWLPDQEHLLVKRVPAARGGPPAPPVAPSGPTIRQSGGETASSTYEARDLLGSAYDEALFTHFATSQLAIVDAATLAVADVGPPDVYVGASPSPDGRWLLVHRLRPPWSWRVSWWRFAREVEVWGDGGRRVATIASLPVADHVPIDGVPTGARDVGWQPTASATLTWVEALDGGAPRAKVPFRDRVVALAAPFAGTPVTLMDAVHRVVSLAFTERGQALVEEDEWERRWRHALVLDVGRRRARAWFDVSQNERYGDPGWPVSVQRPDGQWVVAQDGDEVWMRGDGGSPGGDRPFLDRRSLTTGKATRVLRSGPDVYEEFIAFADRSRRALLIRRQSPTQVPNLHVATLAARVPGAPGEATFARSDRAVTDTPDPTPSLRGVTKRIVTYTRADGVPLSFTLYLPPGYAEGTRLPTVLHAYPREFSDPGTAGQVAGSERTFDRFAGASALFFLLAGYAVLNNTTMPVLGDPLTAYDTFVPQLVEDARAAIEKAASLGVTDPSRVGIIGHSHGGLMTATLLAHSQLFRAGIARSGAYNHTIRPFGFQNERRLLWEARDTYVGLSPVMFAPQIDEPLLLVHGALDENPGTVPLQSERLFEAIRGTGGTARLVMLPFEGHGYAARESVEHVLYEQISWFDRYVKGATPPSPPPAAAP
jgi:dipeptidyl aminopeptidase/acylaminoacyl peptidase